jgi:hypothetical protein
MSSQVAHALPMQPMSGLQNWLYMAAMVYAPRGKFTEWIAQHINKWRLSQIYYNKYPYDGPINLKYVSFSKFYFYERA